MIEYGRYALVEKQLTHLTKNDENYSNVASRFVKSLECYVRTSNNESRLYSSHDMLYRHSIDMFIDTFYVVFCSRQCSSEFLIVH